MSEDWVGSQLETETTPLIDEGSGQTVIIRIFEFKINPELKEFPKDLQALFNAHAKQIEVSLWGEGLVPVTEIGPRVVIGKKKGKGTYRIFVTCQRKSALGYSLKVEGKTKKLQDILRPSA